jgi:hypothetical protein
MSIAGVSARNIAQITIPYTMKTKITILTLFCCLSMQAVADSSGNALGSVPGSGTMTPGVPPMTTIPPAAAPPVTNNPPAAVPPGTNTPPGSFQPVTNSAPGFNQSSSNDASSFVPAGYRNPYANYTNPFYNYTNPYWAAHNTNAPENTNLNANTNWSNTNTSNWSNTNTSSSNISTNRHHWWKWW